MANIEVKDANGDDKYLKSSGAGTDLDPHIPEHLETNSADILADTANIDTNLGTVAGAVAGTEMQVDIVADGAGLATDAKLDDIIADTAAIQTAVEAIQTAVEIIDNAITGSEMQVDIVADGAGLATDAKLDDIIADTGAIQTAVELIDNAISGSEMQVDVVAALPAGANTIGSVNLEPQTSGGLTIFRSIDVDESEEEIKGTAGQIYSMYLYNRSAADRFIKFYNATAASVTVGTTTPVLTFQLAADQGLTINEPNGIAFGTAICIAATTGVADNDTGAPDANDVLANVFYS